MPRRKAVGQLQGARDPITVEWEIADFLSLRAEVDDYLQSPTFFFCDSTWYLEVWPNGKKWISSEGHVGVYLSRPQEDPGCHVPATFSLFLKRTDGTEEILKEKKAMFGRDKGWGKSKVIKRSKLIDQKSRFLPSGVLTVVCSLKCDETRGVGGTVKLLSDLKSLSISGDESDITVRVQSEDFKLHRGILAARTPEFSSVLKHDMKEEATGVVTIADCEAGAFRAFVQYLYTGSTDALSPENVFRLYRIADMYLVDELKRSCLDYMKLNLSVDNFCETIDLALQQEELDLVENATDFLMENASDIMIREDWRDLRRSHTEEISEFLEQGFIRNSKKFKK